VASPNEKDVETMPTQKTFKQRVRARMTKTGESYTAARRQLLRKATEPAGPAGEARMAASTDDATDTTRAPAATELATTELLVSEDAVRRASGKGHPEWFAILDAWGATARTHTEIARWLHETHAVPGWWTQSITVSYERARGMRGRHQMHDGFSVTATKTIAVDAPSLLAAFTDERLRERWLPGVPLRRRPTRAALTARFDWADPPSRVVVNVVAKGDGKALVAVAHEQIQDAALAERLKADWRAWLGQLKSAVERA
jgi:hypothetical protein